MRPIMIYSFFSIILILVSNNTYAEWCAESKIVHQLKFGKVGDSPEKDGDNIIAVSFTDDPSNFYYAYTETNLNNEPGGVFSSALISAMLSGIPVSLYSHHSSCTTEFSEVILHRE